MAALSAVVGQGQTSPLSATDALALAAKNRPALRAAKLKVEEAHQTSRALGAPPATTLGVGASSRSEVGATDGDLFLSQPLDLFGRTAAGRRVGRATVQLAEAEYAQAATELQNEVLNAYAEAVADSHRKEVADELLKISEALLAATKRRFEEGKVAEIQFTRASIEFERAKQTSLLRSSALNASLKRLGGVIGVDPAGLVVVSDAAISPLTNPDIANRFDLLAFNAQAKMAEAEAGLAGTSNRPELDIQLRRSAWNDSPSYVGARVQLTWAFWDHGKSRSESTAAKKRAEAARKLLIDAQAKAFAELNAVAIDLEASQSQVRSYEALLVSARGLVSKSQIAYSEGFGTQVDVLEAARALREVEQELVEAKLRLSHVAIAQYRAAGYLAEVFK